jgi:hypothetical protein
MMPRPPSVKCGSGRSLHGESAKGELDLADGEGRSSDADPKQNGQTLLGPEISAEIFSADETDAVLRAYSKPARRKASR